MVEEKDTADAVIIKKYANRRLYNTKKSSYVTLEDLAQMVRGGEDFIVRDAKSGEDLTRSVLTQIIFEEEAKGHSMLPANFLRQIIRFYGDTMQNFLPSYLDASMNAFSENQGKLRQQLGSAMGVNPAMANFEALTRSNMEWFENAMRVFSPFPKKEMEQSDNKNGKADELTQMKEQLQKMQEQLAKLAKD